ncbi:MAG: sulfate ABC transporter substrate-binding protein [Polyangiaceae bacterium]|nr:sulfate ABC transporter substrate-binding protein [Polyangiaceae bacterium]
MKLQRREWLTGLGGLVGASALGCNSSAAASGMELLNVSYDPTRELYAELNASFIAAQKSSGHAVGVKQSHGGSGKQARAVIDGLEADVVTLALGYDIDQIAERGLIAKDWQTRLPQKSCPYTSTIVFLVRKGNPKGIKDWGDLANDGVEIITPNPKTSGGARWNYLAAWGYEMKRSGGDDAKGKAFVEALLKKVPVLDSGARGSTTTFVERKIGDVLLAWENEARLAVEKLGAGEVEVVVPSVSILAEPPVAWVDKVVEKKKTAELAKAYLEHLYTEEGQKLAAKHHYRPRTEAAGTDRGFAKLDLFTIDDVFEGWQKAQARHFADNGVFDQIYTVK